MRLIFAGCVVLTAFLPCLTAQKKLTVFLITDGEGVAGICRQEQTDTKNPELQRLLTGEVNAAVRGFIKGGAGEVLVWDGHSDSSTLSVATLEGPARLVMGSLGPKMLLERGFDAVAFLGQHARAGRARAVMAHSYSSLGIQRLTMNGKEVGEIETRAALAGVFGVPVIFLSGDQAAADDLLAIVNNAEVAVVKEGLAYYACISLSAGAAQTLIEDKAAAAMRKLAAIRPYKVEGPVEIITEYSTRSTPSPELALHEGADRIDARTIRVRGANFLEAWTRWSSR
jgi:D-amino peptidase